MNSTYITFSVLQKEVSLPNSISNWNTTETLSSITPHRPQPTYGTGRKRSLAKQTELSEVVKIIWKEILWKHSIQSLKIADSVLLSLFMRNNGRCYTVGQNGWKNKQNKTEVINTIYHDYRSNKLRVTCHIVAGNVETFVWITRQWTFIPKSAQQRKEFEMSKRDLISLTFCNDGK